MKFSTNKEKGNAGLGIAIAYYSTNGYTVSIPLNDTQDYDLVVDKNSCLKKVQVKATSCKTKYNKYQVALKSCGGTLGKTYKTIIDTDIDELFIVTDAMDIFIIPIKIITKLIINSFLGAVLLYVINIVGTVCGLHIGINVVTALVVGILGIPGAVLLTVLAIFI